MSVTVTDTAAREIDTIIRQQELDPTNVRLRVGVKGGGCSGNPRGRPLHCWHQRVFMKRCIKERIVDITTGLITHLGVNIFIHGVCVI